MTTAQRSPARRAPTGWVVWQPDEQLSGEVDWSRWYLTDEEDMGESGEQDLLNDLLRSILRVYLEERGWSQIHIGSDQFFAWIEAEPLVRVSPDVYLLDALPPRPLPEVWETWRPEHRPPCLAVEIVSKTNWRKDYQDNPPKYAQLGTRELVIFDPRAARGITRRSERVPLQVFQRTADGALRQAYSGAGPVRCEQLDAWLVAVPNGEAVDLRVARDPAGEDLVPSERESRREKDQALQEKDQALQEKDQALQEKDRALQQALAELARLRDRSGDGASA